jgi:hypothetical protein
MNREIRGVWCVLFLAVICFLSYVDLRLVICCKS